MNAKKCPQYDHCAVLIAEDITSIFLNVISLFNGTLPFIAIQMQALKVDGKLTLIFTRVMDELTRGLIDEDEEALTQPADRAYWESRATKQTLKFTDSLFEIVKQFDQTLEPKYNKPYIGVQKEGLPFNFVTFRPNKKNVNLEIKIPRTDDVDSKLDVAGLDTLEYNSR